MFWLPCRNATLQLAPDRWEKLTTKIVSVEVAIVTLQNIFECFLSQVQAEKIVCVHTIKMNGFTKHSVQRVVKRSKIVLQVGQEGK